MNRPAGVAALAAIILIRAAALAVAGLSAARIFGTRIGLIGGAACVLLAALMAAVAIGLWRLRPWARVLALIGAVMNAGLNCLSVLNALAHLSLLAALWPLTLLCMDALIIWYLLLPRVKRAFDQPLPA